MRIRLYFEPRDLWVGLYWTDTPGKRLLDPRARAGPRDGFIGGFDPATHASEPVTRYEAFACPLPMLVVRLTWFRARATGRVEEAASR